MDDLRIAWVESQGDRLGMTVLPGRRLVGAGGKRIQRDLDIDLERLSHDTQTVVVLISDTELVAHGVGDLVERGLRMRLHVLRRPLDLSQPAPSWLMDEISHWHRSGPVVYVCSSGHGRSAVASAWALRHDGLDADEAVRRVRTARGAKALASAHALVRVREYFEYGAMAQELAWPPTIPTSGLRRAHLPVPRAPWDPTINLFALSFDGSAWFADGPAQSMLLPDLERAFAKANAVDPTLSLDFARACLYTMQRRWRWRLQDADADYDAGPYLSELQLAWALIEHMRSIAKPV